MSKADTGRQQTAGPQGLSTVNGVVNGVTRSQDWVCQMGREARPGAPSSNWTTTVSTPLRAVRRDRGVSGVVGSDG